MGEVVLRGGLGVCLKCASSLFGASLKIRGVFVSLFNALASTCLKVGRKGWGWFGFDLGLV